jgi:WD40 repeat protein
LVSQTVFYALLYFIGCLLGIKVFEQHESHINAVAFSPDGIKIALGLANGVIEVLEAETGKAVMEPLSSQSLAVVLSVNFAPAGDYIVSGSADSSIGGT